MQGLTVDYGSGPVLDDVRFELPSGQLIAIVGPNGAGKSSLLRAALGLVPTRPGADVRFFGEPLAKVRRRVAFMPQRESVDWDFPVRVLDVVTMGLYGGLGLLRRVRKQHREAATRALERVGLGDFTRRQIGALSGGQQKRVFLARTLVQGADLIIMDEPLAGVDAASELIIARELAALRNAGTTVVVVHHDLATVQRDFEHCLLINREVRASGPVDEVLDPHLVASAYGGVVPLALLQDASMPSPSRATAAAPPPTR